MNLGSWAGLIAGVGGGCVAIYGFVILVIGRASTRDKRAFRRPRDAGLYYVCYGLALVLLMMGGALNRHDDAAAAVTALLLAMLLTVAAIRYRPRRGQRRGL